MSKREVRKGAMRRKEGERWGKRAHVCGRVDKQKQDSAQYALQGIMKKCKGTGGVEGEKKHKS